MELAAATPAHEKLPALAVLRADVTTESREGALAVGCSAAAPSASSRPNLSLTSIIDSTINKSFRLRSWTS
jgi:hypothetical protein